MNSPVPDLVDPWDSACTLSPLCDPKAAAGSTEIESSLIEGAWISDRGEQECDHYLEHRLMAQEYEGLRMGRELHDSTGQLLLALRLSVAHLRAAHEAGKSDDILDDITETVRQIDQEIRAFSYLHYPAELGRGGLIGALETLTRGFGDRTGLKIVFNANCDQSIGNSAASVALLRVAQEALMNVHRHAKAQLVRLSLVEQDDLLELSIQDDGRGMPPQETLAVAKGVGLKGMRHRIERLGGQFSIRRLSHGTKLVARLAFGRTGFPRLESQLGPGRHPVLQA
jgi:signal transduction histidine kinase